MRTLVYKMTHTGYPDPNAGVWGRTGCMGQVRGYDFDAVIGVGGTSAKDGIAGKIVWIGIGPRKTGNPRGPLVAFDRFRFYGSQGQMLHSVAPVLAKRVYGRNVRVVLKFSAKEAREVSRLLAQPARALDSSFKTSGPCKRQR